MGYTWGPTSPWRPCRAARHGPRPLGNRRAFAWRRGFFLSLRVDQHAEELAFFSTIDPVRLVLGSLYSSCRAEQDDFALASSAIGGLLRGGVGAHSAQSRTI